MAVEQYDEIGGIYQIRLLNVRDNKFFIINN